MTRTWSVVLLLVSALAGCAPHTKRPVPTYQTVAEDPQRDTATACELLAQAKEKIKAQKWEQAETLLKDALAADMFHGPAHNNLGLVYYHQKKYYMAAWEFQYAIKLMPNRPEPKGNLGLVLEAVGKLDEAASSYSQALAMEADNPQFLGNLARCKVRLHDRSDQTRDLLRQVVLKDTRPDWVTWAKSELIRMGGTTNNASCSQPATMPAAPERDQPNSPESGATLDTDS